MNSGIIANERFQVMPRLNLSNLVLTASQNIQTADAVRRDPAVIKAAKQFAKDGIQVSRSGGALIRETRSSWGRHSEGRKN